LPFAQGLSAIGERLGDMQPADLVGAVQIGKCAGNAKHAMEAARAQLHGLRRLPK